MSDDDAIIRNFHLRATSASSPVYYVRQSEEEIKFLQKENFNLKLKIYLLENKRDGTAKLPEMTNIDEKEYFDLVVENETLKAELNEKKDLMLNALDVIEMLEKQKEEERRKSVELADDYSKRIEELKVRSKMCKRKFQKSKKHDQVDANSNNLSLLQEKLKAFKIQNAELFETINDVKKENISKNLMIEKLTMEKLQICKQCDENNELITALKDKLSQIPIESDMKNLVEQNKALQSKIDELLEKSITIEQKSSKLAQKCRDYERIVNEQSEIMKALNTTIEAKNDEIDDYKAKIEFNSKKFIQDNEINPIQNRPIDSKFPFHNPLFGSFQSLYR